MSFTYLIYNEYTQEEIINNTPLHHETIHLFLPMIGKRYLYIVKSKDFHRSKRDFDHTTIIDSIIAPRKRNMEVKDFIYSSRHESDIDIYKEISLEEFGRLYKLKEAIAFVEKEYKLTIRGKDVYIKQLEVTKGLTDIGIRKHMEIVGDVSVINSLKNRYPRLFVVSETEMKYN